MTPAYFNPSAQPDTETQYRRGGKVNKMQKLSVAKKMPRKFGVGGETNTSPKPTNPMPKGGPKELQDAAAQDRLRKMEEAQRKAGQRRPDLGKLGFKKGGSIRKFADGGETNPDKDVDVSMPHRFMEKDPDIYARARKFVETGNKNDVAATSASYKQGPKKPMSDKAEARSSYDQAKQNPSRSEIKDNRKGLTSGGAGTEPDVPAYRRDAPTLGNRGEKHEFNAENAAMLATLIPGFGAAGRLGQGAYRAGRAAYEGAKGLAEGVKSGVSVAKG